MFEGSLCLISFLFVLIFLNDGIQSLCSSVCFPHSLKLAMSDAKENKNKQLPIKVTKIIAIKCSLVWL